MLIDRLRELRNDLPVGARLSEIFDRAAHWRRTLVSER
jgi:hypothetical protein